MLVRSVSLAVICAVVAVLPIQAHHSHGNYEVAKWTTMDGTVKELHLLVPHSWVYLDVKDRKGRADDLGARSHRSQRAHQSGRQARRRQAGRRHQGPVPSAQGRFQWLPARISHADAWRSGARSRGREGLGRRRRRGLFRDCPSRDSRDK